MIYLPPVNNIQLQSSSQDDPLDTIINNFDDCIHHVTNSWYGNHTNQSKTQAQNSLDQAKEYLMAIKKALPESGSSDEWNTIKQKWGPNVYKNLFDQLYSSHPSLDENIDSIQNEINNNYPPKPGDMTVSNLTHSIETNIYTIRRLIDSGK